MGVERQELCSTCSGSGEVELATGSTEPCPACVGRELYGNSLIQIHDLRKALEAIVIRVALKSPYYEMARAALTATDQQLQPKEPRTRPHQYVGCVHGSSVMQPLCAECQAKYDEYLKGFEVQPKGTK